jgi:hypothetical protein
MSIFTFQDRGFWNFKNRSFFYLDAKFQIKNYFSARLDDFKKQKPNLGIKKNNNQ